MKYTVGNTILFRTYIWTRWKNGLVDRMLQKKHTPISRNMNEFEHRWYLILGTVVTICLGVKKNSLNSEVNQGLLENTQFKVMTPHD